MVGLFLAEESSGGGFAGLFTALGLNWQTFLLNAAAFLVVVYILGRWVYPHLVKALDAKTGELEAATRLEKEAADKLEAAKEQAGKIVSEARGTADEIVTAARADAASHLETERAKTEAQTERMISEARQQLQRDVRVAREELKAETAKLVASATEAVLGEKLDGEHDAKLIGRSLEVK